jgi:AP-2 complex subunit mu-1
MISAFLLVNQKGQIIISRFYRGDVTLSGTDLFRENVIAAKHTGTQPPIRVVDNSTFMYTRHGNLFFVAVTRANANPALAFQFLHQLTGVFKGYFGPEFDEESIKNNFATVFELMDEVMDHGYPQNCALDVLRLYINLGTLREGAEITRAGQLTSQITGTIDWRREGLRYRRNEVFIDVLESVNLLLSQNGNVLRSDVTGTVMMKAFLTGMPECKLGLNDKLVMDRSDPSAAAGGSRANKNTAAGVAFDDCTFHRCVRLGKFDADRSITFIPPDGEFELMRYRINDNVNLPFRIIPAYQEEGKTRMMVNIKAIANFHMNLFATNVVIKVSIPNSTARVKINCPQGRAKYEPSAGAIVWRLRRFTGEAEHMLTADVELIQNTKSAKPWARPPISVDFQVPMFASSGLNVRFLKVYEKSGYKTTKWVKFVTRAGQYQIRI